MLRQTLKTIDAGLLGGRIRNRLHARRFLFRYIRDGDVGTEIGLGRGEFSEILLSTRRLKRLYLIDSWVFQPDFATRWYGGAVARSQADMDELFEGVRQRLARFAAPVYLRDFSADAAGRIAEGELDWVYVDGSHYYNHVLADLEAFAPKVRVGGHIICDDHDWKTETGTHDVRRALETFLARHGERLERVETRNGQAVIRVSAPVPRADTGQAAAPHGAPEGDA